MSDNLNAAEQVPAELWMNIFELMESPADLNAIVRTCRAFHRYGTRALHRTLIWRSPEDVVANLPLWDIDPGMYPGVKSLELRVSTVPDDVPATLVTRAGDLVRRNPPDPPVAPMPNLQHPHAHPHAQPPVPVLVPPFWHPGQHIHWQDDIVGGGWAADWIADQVHNMQQAQTSPERKSVKYYKLYQHFASATLYDGMLARIEGFVNLESLAFRDVIFTDSLFGTIHALPNLRKLRLEFCLFPSRNSLTARDHSTLPITELTLLNLRRQVVRGGDTALEGHHAFADMDDDIECALGLALAENLRTLRVDSTADVFGSVYRKRQGGVYVFNIPPHLESLYVQRKQLFDGTVQPTYAGEQLFPGAVYSIMERAPTLTTVSLAYPLPKHSSFPRADVLPNLTRCEGVLETVVAMTSGRPLEAISILRSDTPTDGILEMLARKAKEHPNLQVLSLHCKTWDIEILDAICQLFPQLRQLKLTFDLREPGKMWEHRDYWTAVHPYEYFEVIEDARMQHEFQTGSRGPDEVSACFAEFVVGPPASP